MVKELTTEKYWELANDPINKKTLNAVARKFPRLSADDIESAKGYSIWKTFLNHKNGEFSRLLFFIMKRQCMSMSRGKKIKTCPLLRDYEAKEQVLDGPDLPEPMFRFDKLDSKERQVIEHRLNGWMSFAKIAKHIGKSTEGTRQIYNRALRKLRNKDI